MKSEHTHLKLSNYNNCMSSFQILRLVVPKSKRIRCLCPHFLVNGLLISKSSWLEAMTNDDVLLSGLSQNMDVNRQFPSAQTSSLDFVPSKESYIFCQRRLMLSVVMYDDNCCVWTVEAGRPDTRTVYSSIRHTLLQ